MSSEFSFPQSAEASPLRGLRRELSQGDFEELCALQCEVPEILGWAGVSEAELSAWVEGIYHLPLPEVMAMVRQDGLIEIRKASFDQLKKSAALIQQQYNRFLAGRGDPRTEEAKQLARQVFSLGDPDPEAVRALFSE